MTRLVVCVPLRLEARAVRRGLTTARLVRTGYGPRRATRAATRLGRFDALAVIGLAGAVGDGPAPGEVLVASEIRGAGRTRDCPSAELLAAALRQAGCTVHTGPLASVDHLVGGPERALLAGSGVRAVDMESAQLAALAGNRPVAVVRVIVDTPAAPLLSFATIRHGRAALRTLRGVGPALERWAADGPCGHSFHHTRGVGPQ